MRCVLLWNLLRKGRKIKMPKHGENVFPIPVSAEAAADLEAICEHSGLIKTHVLRYAIEAALRALAECDHVKLPIQFIIGNEHGRKEKNRA